MNRRMISQQSFGNRYGMSPEGLLIWLDGLDGRSCGNVASWNDLSGNGYHATQSTAENQPTIGSSSYSIASQVRIFGNSKYMTFGDNDKFSFAGGGDIPFSFCAWVNMQASTVTQPILHKRDDRAASTHYEWTFRITSTEVFSNICYSADSGSAYRGRISNAALSAGWQFLTATYSGAGTVGSFNLYRNGVIIAMTDSSSGAYTSMTNTATAMELGHAPADTDNQYWQNSMNAIMVFRNRVLTAAEIARIYNRDCGKYNLG